MHNEVVTIIDTSSGPTFIPAKSWRRTPPITDHSRSAEPQSTPHYTMPYLKTSTEWYEQSSLLLKARPTSVGYSCHWRDT